MARAVPSAFLPAVSVLAASVLAASVLAVAALVSLPMCAVAAEWETRSAPGLLFEYAPEDDVLAGKLWPVMIADRKAIMERLRIFPPDTLRVRLAPTWEAFAAALQSEMPSSRPLPETLGVYLLNRRTILLRSPRTDLAGGWDLRGVMRHELAHGVLDMAIAQPVPLWLHEGLAILLSDDLGYLDEAQLTFAAVTDRLIPLAALLHRFPSIHGARTVAYSQAASFVRFLLRQAGMTGLRDLLKALERGMAVQDAFSRTYGMSLYALERQWQGELAQRFSYFTLITSTSLLGGLGAPLVLLGVLRRWLQRRRKFREWDYQERALAAVRGVPPPGE